MGMPALSGTQKKMLGMPALSVTQKENVDNPYKIVYWAAWQVYFKLSNIEEGFEQTHGLHLFL